MTILAIYLVVGIISFILIDQLTRNTQQGDNILTFSEGIILIVLWPLVYVKLLNQLK